MLIQKARHFSLNEPGFDGKVKGVTRIELMDAKTGKRKVVESENTFMASNLAIMNGNAGQGYNVVNNVLDGMFNNNYYNRYPSDYALAFMRRTVGGILLFEDAITEGSRYMNAGNKMTANSYFMCSNSGNPTELGSYNSSESSIGDSSFVLVYDWTTSQGNGDISSVCLSSERGGLYGYGNASGNRITPSTDYNGNYALQMNSGQNYVRVDRINSITYDGNTYTIVTGFKRNNVFYQFYWNTTTRILIMAKHRMATGNSFSIFNGRSIGQKVFDLSSATSSTNNNVTYGVCWDGYDKALVFFGPSSYGQTITNGTSRPYAVIDLTDDTITTGTFTNNTSYTMRMLPFVYDNETGHIVSEIGTGSGLGTMHGFGEINLVNGALEKTYYYNNDAETDCYFNKLTTDGLWLVQTGGTSTSAKYIYDDSAETMYPINGVWDSDMYQTVLDRRTNLLQFYTDYGDYYKSYYNPMFLSTINNLDSTVTKNNTQTMKVTYTLTEA